MKSKSQQLSLFALILFIIEFPGLASAQFCQPLPDPPQGALKTTVSTPAALISAVKNAAPNTTIYIADGTYRVRLYITTNGLTLRSLSGNRNNVTIDGGYTIGEPVGIAGADDVTIADLTIQLADNHLVHVSGNALRTKLYNLKLMDSREQFVKINDNNGAPNFGEIACSHFELTPAGRTHIHNNPTPGFACYTGGIDTHEGDNWTVRDNYFKDIYCTNGGLAEHCIHFWDGADNTVVERNVVVNCARGIGFGLGSQGTTGGRIVNNFICADIPGSPGHDVGIGLERARNTFVAHNSIYAASGGTNASLDVRFSETSGTVVNNLYTSFLWERDNPTAVPRNNHKGTAALFTAPGTCNLHLKAGASGIGNVIDQAEDIQVIADIDGGARGTSPDIGADEFGQSAGDTLAPAPPSNLQSR